MMQTDFFLFLGLARDGYWTQNPYYCIVYLDLNCFISFFHLDFDGVRSWDTRVNRNGLPSHGAYNLLKASYDNRWDLPRWGSAVAEMGTECYSPWGYFGKLSFAGFWKESRNLSDEKRERNIQSHEAMGRSGLKMNLCMVKSWRRSISRSAVGVLWLWNYEVSLFLF